MQVNKILKQAVSLLSQVGVQSASLDARLLLKFCLDYSEEDLLRNHNQEITSEQESSYLSLIERRKFHEPIAYITGMKEFWGYNFIVNKDVLIPRPDSETIIAAALSKFSDINKPLKILDIGTGSGCLLCTLLMEYPSSTAIGIDISEAALKIAKQNIDLHNLQARAKIQLSNLFDSIKIEQFDLIICNPPYIAKSETCYMNTETQFEPEIALFAENNGLLFYERIAQELNHYMNDNALASFEIGFSQKNQVVKIFEKHNLYIESVVNDLSGISRCVIVRK